MAVRVLWMGMLHVLSCSGLSESLWLHGLQPIRLLCPWDFPGKNTGVGCCFLLQGIFLTQGSNPCLLHWQTGSLPLSHQGTPIVKLVPIANLWLLWINESSSDMDVAGSSLSYKQRKLGLHLLIGQVTDFFAESNSGFPIVREYPFKVFCAIWKQATRDTPPFNFHYWHYLELYQGWQTLASCLFL